MSLRDQRFAEVLAILEAVLSRVEPAALGLLSEDDTIALAQVASESMLLAALDLLDHNEVARLITPSGRTLFQVSGAGAPYLVSCGPTPYAYHCGCASFAHGVLATSTHVVCKHLLACLLGQRLGRCVDRAVGFDYLATVARGFTLSDDDAGT